MNTRKSLALAAALAAWVVVSPAAGQIALRFEPPDQHVDVGESGSLSVMLDDAIEVRTIEMWISYDASLVTSDDGDSGQIFTASGCPLFPVYEEDAPGAWYGGTVTLGSTCVATGPGELYRWSFTGIAKGICTVQVDSVVLYDPFAEVIAGVTLEETTILVGIVSSAGPPSPQGLTLTLSPNPFNPRTTVRFGGLADESVAVEVFDLNGRLLDTLWRGRLGTQPGIVPWEGTDGAGRTVSSGTYLFRISSPGGRQATEKGILLK